MDGENVKVMPTDNVYSYFMFLGPLERYQGKKGLSWALLFAWLLIALNLFLQCTILYAIFKSVVAGDVDWRNGIVSERNPFNNVNPFAEPPPKCNPGGSLCSENNGTFSCAPPSVQLAGRWSMLDTDSDGIWTREEVLKARKDLQCQFAVDPLEVFNVFVNFLKKREEVIWLHPLVKSGKAIHKHYFDFAKGDIIMCNYRNEEMCPNLLQRGFFDGPLKTGKSPRVGKTIESALNYCYDLLKSGGVCERSLPSAYSVWRKASEDQCLGAEYNKFVYKHPKTGSQKSLLAVDYAAVSDYEKGRNSRLFIIYKSIIIMMFGLCMVVELQDCFVAFTWALTFPAETDVDEPVNTARTETSPALSERTPRSENLTPRSTHSNAEKTTIHGITSQHRMMVYFLIAVRFVIAMGLLWVGTVFLIQDTDYVNLLLNGVALVFVIQIANCLYAQLLSDELREKFEETEPFSVPMANTWKWFWFRNPAMRDLFRMALIFGVLCSGMYLHYTTVAKPLSKALECTCLSQGNQCFEAKAFDKNFWQTYWGDDVPEIFATVDQMKKEASKADEGEGEGEDEDEGEGEGEGVEGSHEIIKLPLEKAPANAAFIHQGVNGNVQPFTTMKVNPSDVEMVPVQHGQGQHKHLLNGRRHRVVRLLNGRTLK